MMDRLQMHRARPPATGEVGASPPADRADRNGSLTDGAAGTIDGVVADDGQIAASPPEPSDYSVRLEDAFGQTIAVYPVTPQHAETHAEDFVSYVLAAPRPENFARAVLLYGETPLAERVGSPNVPVVALTSPLGGEQLNSQPLTITWDASDADGEALTFNVDYSTDDGATWTKLGWNWTETQLTIDSAQPPGSGQAHQGRRQRRLPHGVRRFRHRSRWSTASDGGSPAPSSTRCSSAARRSCWRASASTRKTAS